MPVFFTAAVCVYNTEKYLRECLDSILNQSYKNFELLIVDDGSTDSSGCICDEYAEKDSRVRVIHTENQGVLLARKTAFENARGDYFIVFDSDDTVSPELFSRLSEKIEQCAPDMIFFDYNKINGENITHEKTFDGERTFNKDSKKELWELLLRSKFNSLCCKCIRRDKFDYDINAAHYKGYSRGEDRLVSAHMLSRLNTFCYLPEALYNYRTSASSLTRTYSFENLVMSSRATEEIRQMISADGCLDGECEALICSLARMIYRNFLYPNAVSLSKKETVELIKKSESLGIYKLCTDRRADKYSSKPENLKFSLLRNKKYSLLVDAVRLKSRI